MSWVNQNPLVPFVPLPPQPLEIPQLANRMAAIDDELMVQMVNLAFTLGQNCEALKEGEVQLTKENITLTGHINQLKIVHISEWQSTYQDYRAKKGLVASLIRTIVERFSWVKEYYLDVTVEQLKINLRNAFPCTVGRGHSRAQGIVQVRAEMDACLADEGCDSVFTYWMELNSNEAASNKILDYPGYTVNAKREPPQIAPHAINQIAEQQQNRELAPNYDLVMNKFFREPMEKYNAMILSVDTIRAANRALSGEKEVMKEAHTLNLKALKRIMTINFELDLEKAQTVYKQTEKNIAREFKEIHSNEIKFPQEYIEGYIAEVKLIQGLLRPLISTLETIIPEYKG